MFKINNAIILAAGRGSRMQELTNNTPKPLLKVDETPMIENIIKSLKRITKKITIVVGYLSDQFDYLKDKYNVSLIFNEQWNDGNNILSLMKVKHLLSNTLIINGDVIIKDNSVLKKRYNHPCFYVEKNENIEEWLAIFDNHKNIIDFNKNPVNMKGFYQREVTVVNEKLSKKIKKEILDFDTNEYFEFLILKCSKKYNIPIKSFKIKSKMVFDLDNSHEYLKYINKK